MEGLQPGRIVNYVMKNGEIRALIVARVWESGPHPGYLNGVLLVDGSNDEGQLPFSINPTESLVPPAIWVTSTWYDEEKQPGTWHWPPRPQPQPAGSNPVREDLQKTFAAIETRFADLEAKLSHHGIVGPS